MLVFNTDTSEWRKANDNWQFKTALSCPHCRKLVIVVMETWQERDSQSGWDVTYHHPVLEVGEIIGEKKR